MEDGGLLMSDDKVLPSPAPQRDFFPMSIVWCPLPIFNCFIPFIGHLGIATSTGVIHDFVGPYTVHKNQRRLGFGSVTKFYPVKPEQLTIPSDDSVHTIEECWDHSIEMSSQKYEGLIHDLFFNNCHSHVAMVLNRMEFRGYRHWNTFTLIIFMLTHGKYVSKSRFFMTYLGFLIVLSLALFFFVFVDSIYS